MDPSQTAHEIARPMNDLGGRFMLSGRTFSKGMEHGFAGLDFYFCGRAGVLGEVDGSTVVAELGFFEPANVISLWESGGRVMSREQAAAHFMECAYEWAHARMPAGAPFGEFADLVRAPLEASGDDQPTLFTAWRDSPWPTDDLARAMHSIHLLRELRGGHHVHAIRNVGLDPHAAIVVASGEGNAELFGWTEPHPEPEDFRITWQQAEEQTNDQVAKVLASLDSEELDRLTQLVRQLTPAS